MLKVLAVAQETGRGPIPLLTGLCASGSISFTARGGRRGPSIFQSHQIATGSSHGHPVAGASSSSLEYWTRTATSASQFDRWIAPQTQSSHHEGQPVATQAENVQGRTSVRMQCGWNAVLSVPDALRAGLRDRSIRGPKTLGRLRSGCPLCHRLKPQIIFHPQV